MAFAPDEMLKDETGILSKLPMDQIWSVAKLLLIAVVGLIAIKMIRPKPEPVLVADGGMLNAQGGGGPGQPPRLDANGDPIALPDDSEETSLEDEISLAQVDGTMKAGALKRVGDVVSVSPTEAAAVIRQWMNA
jgi:flagellar M-ring protein FliF